MSAELDEEVVAALDRGDREAAATAVVRGYGPAILGYLRVLLRDDASAAEAFAVFSEDLWRGLPGFRREASVRTWVYALAYHAALRVGRDAYRRRGRRLETTDAARLAAEVRSVTAEHLRTENKDRLASLRDALTPAEQTLLVLKLDRDMSWREVAEVLGDGADEATLRKRYERLKLKLRKLARGS